MRMKENKVNKDGLRRLPLSVYLTYLLVVTLLFCSVTLSSYVSSATGSSSAKVAKFDVTITPGTTTFFEDNYTGQVVHTSDETNYTYSPHPAKVTPKSYSFTVTRNANTEVTTKTIIQITLPKAIPAGITMQLKRGSDIFAPAISGNGLVYTYTDDSVAPGASSSKTYELKFIVNTTNDSRPYELILDDMQLDVTVEQVN